MPAAGNIAVSSSIDYLVEMLLFIPPIFVLVGLLDVWVPRKIVEKHIGPESGAKGVAISILVATAAAGPLYAGFPVADALLKKGCRLANAVIFLGTWATIKIPMLMIEIKFMDLPFALTRLARVCADSDSDRLPGGKDFGNGQNSGKAESDQLKMQEGVIVDWFNLEEIKEFSLLSHVKKMICEFANTKALLICFEAGQSVPPCIMESDVYFYTIDGHGLLYIENRSVEVKTGILIMVPAGVERKIQALSRLTVLAIQVH